MSAPVAETASPGEVVAWSFDRLNDHDVTALRSLWTAATVERFPDRTCHGADEIAAYFERVFAALPDFHMRVVALVEQGEDVFVHWQLTATHTGTPFSGIAATGRRIEIDGMDHFVMRHGALVSNFVVFDQMQFARAAGLLPADGSPADRGLKAAFNAKTRVAARVRG